PRIRLSDVIPPLLEAGSQRQRCCSTIVARLVYGQPTPAPDTLGAHLAPLTSLFPFTPPSPLLPPRARSSAVQTLSPLSSSRAIIQRRRQDRSLESSER